MLCCVCERERIYFKTWLMSPEVLCVQRCRAGKQAGDSEGLMLQTESKGGLDDSVAGLSLFPLRFRKIMSLIITLILHNF